MPVACTFVLNRRSMSSLHCPGIGHIPAFSGNGRNIDNPDSTGVVGSGPLPVGTYYIVDRQSGGRMGWLWDVFKDVGANTNRSTWFALYRNDDKVDDQTFVKGVRRGNFRLHPIGRYGESDGCITLPSIAQFDRLRAILKAQRTRKIPGTNLDYYGTVTVR
ncbi:DUF2778 domain-containing protein (plasmid) [Ralstonia syzygii subsp. celebesensis]|uniref:DUF2778 domain-containing protein n=1 Tax=Ralstonia solanacearum species complex TaxID=3116862 RepID=UPI000B3B3167|nr:DUF2778 domain-containing protein [Ralstonia solanacearum]